MKNKFIALLFITLSLQMVAKNDSTSVIKNGIGLSIAPMLSMPSFVNQNNYTNNVVKGSIGGTAAICENIVLSKKQNFYLYAELGYQTYAYINQYPAIIFGNGNTVSVKVIDRNSYGFFSLSLQKVIFKVSKVGMFVGLGAQASYCYAITQTTEQVNNVNGQAVTSTQSSTSYDIQPDYQMAAAGVARLGFFANPTKHLTLNIAPVFYYGLNPKYLFKKNDPGYNSIGLNLQIMYSF